jgi:hypothetical protein
LQRQKFLRISVCTPSVARRQQHGYGDSAHPESAAEAQNDTVEAATAVSKRHIKLKAAAVHPIPAAAHSELFTQNLCFYFYLLYLFFAFFF